MSDPLSLLDTPGCFARDIQTLAKVMKVLTVASIPREFGNTSVSACKPLQLLASLTLFTF
jgi:hypothetical protein